jgi:TATA-binding protein-associated factor Taf7
MLSELQNLIEAKEEENNESLKKLDDQLEERERHTEYLQNKIAQLQQNLQLLRYPEVQFRSNSIHSLKEP